MWKSTIDGVVGRPKFDSTQARGACGSFVNCPLTGDSLDEDGAQDLVACCELLKKRYPKAKTLIVHLATDPPDVAVSA